MVVLQTHVRGRFSALLQAKGSSTHRLLSLQRGEGLSCCPSKPRGRHASHLGPPLSPLARGVCGGGEQTWVSGGRQVSVTLPPPLPDLPCLLVTEQRARRYPGADIKVAVQTVLCLCLTLVWAAVAIRSRRAGRYIFDSLQDALPLSVPQALQVTECGRAGAAGQRSGTLWPATPWTLPFC